MVPSLISVVLGINKKNNNTKATNKIRTQSYDGKHNPHMVKIDSQGPTLPYPQYEIHLMSCLCHKSYHGIGVWLWLTLCPSLASRTCICNRSG